MAAITILPIDTTGQALSGWQLLKSRSIVQTALTAAQLSQNLRDVVAVETTVEVIPVTIFDAIRFQVWGTASDNDAPVVDLYGWDEPGPGFHIGKITLAYGNFTSAASTGFHAKAATHSSIRNAFDSATAYRGCDTYTVSNDYEQEMFSYTNATLAAEAGQSHRAIVTPCTQAATPLSPIHADFPSYAIVDFRRSRYKYFGVLVTTLAGTNLGAIFKPVALRGGYTD